MANYLSTEAALDSLRANVYWPKWDSPWWHMLLLHEMGETAQIPAEAIHTLTQELAASPLKLFPLRPEEIPAHVNPALGVHCHCALGSIYQVLAAWGVDVDKELPWIRPWFRQYQMADGGLNCDETAYLVEGECPSSMVATIASFEAILRHGEWTPEDREFLDRAAQFLITRRLTEGSPTQHNCDEREECQKWRQLCFPRFYFYDQLRGLDALLEWSEKTGQPLPREAIQGVFEQIQSQFPDDQIRIQRRAYDQTPTRWRLPDGTWERREHATTFPLLEEVSRVGEVSSHLTKQWQRCQARRPR